MLRYLEHGVPIRMQMTRHRTLAVDTKSDLEAVSKLIAKPSW
jgi:CMP-2-keto-3-deoxyoctulosonic acid synthetase